MKFKSTKKHEHLQGNPTSGFFVSLKTTINTIKGTKYAISTSPRRFNSRAEEESFRIQAELSRSNAILHEVMIPPR